jgi:hypothetical protein
MPQATQATNEFPMPANLRPPAPPSAPPATNPTPDPSPFARLRLLAGQEVFTLDPDLRLALEDMCQAAEGTHWRERWQGWLSQIANEGIRSYLGR